MSAPRWLKPYLPNTSSRLALISLDRPADAHWPIRLTQIVGGKTWSISFVRFQTREPMLSRIRPAEPVEQESPPRIRPAQPPCPRHNDDGTERGIRPEQEKS